MNKRLSQSSTNQVILSRLKMEGITTKTAKLTETYKGVKVNNTLLTTPKCAAIFCNINNLSVKG